MQTTRYVIMKMLDAEGYASFDRVRWLILVAMPGMTGVAPSSSPDEIREEYELVASEIEYLCGEGVRISGRHDMIEVISNDCRKLLRRKISELEVRKRSMPRLISMYLSAASAMLASHAGCVEVE